MKLTVLQEVLSFRSDFKLRVAVLGSQGSGKSSLIHAFLKYREGPKDSKALPADSQNSSHKEEISSFVNSSDNVITSRNVAPETDVESLQFPIANCEVAVELWD